MHLALKKAIAALEQLVSELYKPHRNWRGAKYIGKDSIIMRTVKSVDMQDSSYQQLNLALSVFLRATPKLLEIGLKCCLEGVQFLLEKSWS